MRLADRVFAPHYAAPLPRTLAASARLMSAPSADAEPLVALAPGAAFEMLDVTGGWAWGIAAEHGLVGYVDAAALEERA